MNVLFLTDDESLFEEGSDRRLQLQEMSVALEHVTVVSRVCKKVSPVVSDTLEIYPFRSPWCLAPFFLERQARHLAKTHTFDAVMVDEPFERGWVAARLSRRIKIPLYVQVRTDYLSPWFVRKGIYRSPRARTPFMNKLRIRIAGKVLPQAVGIRTVSKRVRDSLIERYGDKIADPYIVAPLVPEERPDPIPLPERPFTFTLAVVSTLSPENRIEDVLYAIKRLHDAYPSLGACIIGDGSERTRLTRLARSLGIAEKVLFMGSHENAWGLAQSAQAYIQASGYKGYGTSLVRAALMRIPTVSTDVGIVGEVLVGYQQILAAPVGDPTNLAAHIAWLIEDQHARKELAMSAEVAVRVHLTAIPRGAAAQAAHIVQSLTPHV